MSTFPRRIGAVAALACLLLASVGLGLPVATAKDVPIRMYGSRAAGWGLTNTSLTSPGPPLTVEVGDNVILNLSAVDTIQHNWFIDYDNDTFKDASEAGMTQTFGQTPVLFNFTVSNVTGTFRYRSDREPGPGSDRTLMWGNITIRNATSGGLFSVDAVTLAVVGIVIFVVAIAVMALLFRGRRREPPVPPPPED